MAEQRTLTHLDRASPRRSARTHRSRQRTGLRPRRRRAAPRPAGESRLQQMWASRRRCSCRPIDPKGCSRWAIACGMGAQVTTGSPSTRVSADLVRRCAACLRDVFALSPVRVTTPYEYMRLIMIGPHHRAHRHVQSDPRCHISRARSTARARERRVLHELVLLNGHDCATQALDGVHSERSGPQLRLQLVPARASASAQGRVCAWKRGKAAACKRECAGWGWHAVPAAPYAPMHARRGHAHAA